MEELSTKGLTKDLIDGHKILNGTKYFPSRIFQNHLVFMPAKNSLNILMVLLEFIRENLMECHKKVLKVFAPTFDNHCILVDVNFNGHCLIKNKTSIPKKMT